MSRIFARLLPAVLVLAIAGGLAAEGEVTFAYHYEADQTAQYKTKFSYEIDFKGFVSTQFVDMEVTEKCVGAAEDGGYKMEMKFDLVESSRMMFENMQEDKMGEQLTGQAISYILDRHGKFTKLQPIGLIEGWEQLEETISNTLKLWYPHMPDEKVAAGGDWVDDSADSSSGMDEKFDTRFTFEGMKKEEGRDCAKVVADIASSIKGTQTTPMGEFDTVGAGEGKTEFYFDPETSAIVKSKGKVEYKMEMTPAAGGDPNPVTVNFEMERELK